MLAVSNCNTPQLLPASAWKEKKCRQISKDWLFSCEGEFYSLLFKQPYLYLMTNSDGDNWEEDWIHISKAIWLPSFRDGATVAPGNAASTKNSTTAQRIDWVWGLMGQINLSCYTASVAKVQSPINFCITMPQMQEIRRDPPKTAAKCVPLWVWAPINMLKALFETP